MGVIEGQSEKIGVSQWLDNCQLKKEQIAIKASFEHFFNSDYISSCKSILDIGSGDGLNTAAIAKHFPKVKVVGLDASESMVMHALATYPNTRYPNLSFVHQRAQDFHFDEQFFISHAAL